MTSLLSTNEDIDMMQRFPLKHLRVLDDDPTTFGTALGLIFFVTHLLWGYPPIWAAALSWNLVGVGGIAIALSMYVRDQGRSWGFPAIFSLAKPRTEVIFGVTGHLVQAVIGTWLLLH